MTVPEIGPTRALALYEAEHELLALMDAEEQELGPEQEEEIQAALSEMLQYAVEKRESFGLFLMFLQRQVELARQEITRLRGRIERMENLDQRLRKYGVNAIRSLGTDHKGKFRKLVGHTITLFVRALPASVLITDEQAVPSEFKRLTIQLPATLYERLATVAPVLVEQRIVDVHIDKELIRRAIEQGREVPGADLRLSGHDHALVVK